MYLTDEEEGTGRRERAGRAVTEEGALIGYCDLEISPKCDAADPTRDLGINTRNFRIMTNFKRP